MQPVWRQRAEARSQKVAQSPGMALSSQEPGWWNDPTALPGRAPRGLFARICNQPGEEGALSEALPRGMTCQTGLWSSSSHFGEDCYVSGWTQIWTLKLFSACSVFFSLKMCFHFSSLFIFSAATRDAAAQPVYLVSCRGPHSPRCGSVPGWLHLS